MTPGPPEAVSSARPTTIGTRVDGPGRPPNGPSRTPRRKTLSRRQGIVALVAVFVASRIGFAFAGVRFDDSALHPQAKGQVQWQLLDVRLLRHDLFTSIWYLHSQPPLYNLSAGVLLHLPVAIRSPVAGTSFLLLGLTLVLATFLLLEDLGVARWIALAVAVVVVLDPAAVLFENWLSWTYPTATFITVGGLAASRLIHTGSVRWSMVAFASFAIVLLTDPTFQWPWLAVLAGLVLYAARGYWRTIAIGALAPMLLVSVWYMKNAVLFGTATTSSWMGMNLSHITLGRAPPGAVKDMVARGTLSPIAEIGAFGPVDSYVPRFVHGRVTGIQALDERSGPSGVPNYNNLAYVDVSRAYLRQGLDYIRAAPGSYLSSTVVAMQLWAVPADRFPFLHPNRARIAAYADAFDATVGGQPRAGDGAVDLVFRGRGQGRAPGELSWTAAGLSAICLLLGPLALALRRGCCTLGTVYPALLWTTVYGFVLSALLEVGENMRFRFELGTIPLVVATATVVSLVPSRRSASGPAA